ncbi:MAG: cation-translocating P-type ATPase [bacterium]
MRTPDRTRVELRVGNLDCENEAAQIRRGLEHLPGITELRVFPKSAKVMISIDDAQFNLDTLKTTLTQLGFPILPSRSVAKAPKPWKNPKVITSVISGIVLGVAYLLEMSFGLPLVYASMLYAVGMLFGGYYFGREALEELWQEHEIGIELLMTVAAIAAFVLGQPAEALTLVFLYSISEALESYTEAKTRNAIRALMDLTPKFATVMRNGKASEIPVEEIALSEIFLVRPGQSIPTDGKVISGSSSVNQSPVTGESIPVQKQIGDTVFAGTINEEGALEIEATKTFENNTVARIIHLVEAAQEEKGKSERFIRRFGKWYSPAVLVIGIVIALLPALFDGGWWTWAIRATVFIVAAAPCALVISIPITMVSALGTGARNGVLIKGGVYLEELAKVKVVALDKTGTLTLGKPQVSNVLSLNHLSESEVLKLAAAVERYSQHPLAKAIVDEAEKRTIISPYAEQFQSLTNQGAVALVENRKIYVGSPSFYAQMLATEITAYKDRIDTLQKEGKTVVLVGDGNEIFGAIAIRDRFRPNGKETLQALRKQGIQRIVMLTGDNIVTASAIADEAGVDEFFADLKPEDKSIKIKHLEEKYGRVMMVGDGVNDAPALARATVGVAMGAAGTDIAMETADVALMGDDLSKLAYTISLSHRTMRVVRQNLALSMIVIAGLIVGSLSGGLTLPIAVIGHELSEFAVIASGLRLLRS